MVFYKMKKYIISAALLITNYFAFSQNKKTEAAFRKTCSEIANAFAKKNIKSINKYINPQTGLYVVARPGAIDDFTNQKKLDTKNPFKISYPYKDTSSVKKHFVKYGAAPKFDCGSMAWNNTGFVADSSAKFKRISDIMNFRIKNEGVKYSMEDFDKINTTENVNRKVVFTEIAKKHGLVFYLSFINGKWYLTIIDTVASNCGA